jgi:hypothetical protein
MGKWLWLVLVIAGLITLPFALSAFRSGGWSPFLKVLKSNEDSIPRSYLNTSIALSVAAAAVTANFDPPAIAIAIVGLTLAAASTTIGLAAGRHDSAGKRHDHLKENPLLVPKSNGRLRLVASVSLLGCYGFVALFLVMGHWGLVAMCGGIALLLTAAFVVARRVEERGRAEGQRAPTPRHR